MVPKIYPKSRKTRPRVFDPNPHCDLRFGGPAPRPPIFCGIVRTLLMLRFQNAESQILVRKRSRKFVRELSKSSGRALWKGPVFQPPCDFPRHGRPVRGRGHRRVLGGPSEGPPGAFGGFWGGPGRALGGLSETSRRLLGEPSESFQTAFGDFWESSPRVLGELSEGPRRALGEPSESSGRPPGDFCTVRSTPPAPPENQFRKRNTDVPRTPQESKKHVAPVFSRFVGGAGGVGVARPGLVLGGRGGSLRWAIWCCYFAMVLVVL